MRARNVSTQTRCGGCSRADVAVEVRLCAECKELNLALPVGIGFGEWCEIIGRVGVYRVTGFNRDGSLTLYGGDRNPNGRRGYKNAYADRLRPAEGPYRED